MFIVSIILASFSQIILKLGAKEKNIYINKYTISGYLILFISTICTLIGYGKVELTLSGILQSFSFIFVPIFSFIIIGEKISKYTFFGIGLIIMGLIIYAL